MRIDRLRLGQYQARQIGGIDAGDEAESREGKRRERESRAEHRSPWDD
jgi:hypothetical protein